MMDLYEFDVEATKHASGRQNAAGAVKLAEDLDRYRKVIVFSRPDLLVECGTYKGASARWFAENGVEQVVTIDIDPKARDAAFDHPRVTYLTGSSSDPAVVERVCALADGRRVMVSLDSYHDAANVAREIQLYAPLVSVGCYIVVEDGALKWMPHWLPPGDEGPLKAIEETLAAGNPAGFARNVAVEGPVSMCPAGWWRREPF